MLTQEEFSKTLNTDNATIYHRRSGKKTIYYTSLESPHLKNTTAYGEGLTKSEAISDAIARGWEKYNIQNEFEAIRQEMEPKRAEVELNATKIFEGNGYVWHGVEFRISDNTFRISFEDDQGYSWQRKFWYIDADTDPIHIIISLRLMDDNLRQSHRKILHNQRLDRIRQVARKSLEGYPKVLPHEAPVGSVILEHGYHFTTYWQIVSVSPKSQKVVGLSFNRTDGGDILETLTAKQRNQEYYVMSREEFDSFMVLSDKIVKVQKKIDSL